MLANTKATTLFALESAANYDPLDALHVDILDGMKADANVDMFLHR